MTEVPFHATRMGVRFYEHTLPELVRQVTRLADAVERLGELHVPAGVQPQPKMETQDDPEVRDQDPQPPIR